MKRIYYNEKQARIISSPLKTKVFLGGRGSGKSTVIGDESYQCVYTMPKSRGFFASATMEILLTRCLPSIIERWESMGFEEDVDFVVRKKPKSWFETPYQAAKSYEKTISWSNGAVIDLISIFEKDPGRGGNYQWGFIDEAGLCDYEKISKSLRPAMRGNFQKVARIEVPHNFIPPFGRTTTMGRACLWEAPFAQNPRYGLWMFTSTVPWSITGKWLLDKETDPEVCWVESTWQDNVAVLGPNYGNMMRESLPEAVYRVEVMNERPGRLPNSFYPEFDEARHLHNGIGLYRADQPLEISLDFNASFNSMIVCQDTPNAAYVHDALYVKGNQTVEDLIIYFLKKYEGHNRKEVDIYGDRNGSNQFANSRQTIYQQIEGLLGKHGWKYHRPHKGLDAPHKDKHEMLNQALKATKGLKPILFNKYNTGALVQSIMFAPITQDFKKDKTSERRLKHTDFRERATDLSDCFDNWYFFKYKDAWRRSAMNDYAVVIG